MNRNRSLPVSIAVLASTVFLLVGCSKPEDKPTVNPATMTKDQRLQHIGNDASLTPEQKAEKRARVEQLEKQTQEARAMGGNIAAPAGLKK